MRKILFESLGGLVFALALGGLVSATEIPYVNIISPTEGQILETGYHEVKWESNVSASTGVTMSFIDLRIAFGMPNLVYSGANDGLESVYFPAGVSRKVEFSVNLENSLASKSTEIILAAENPPLILDFISTSTASEVAYVHLTKGQNNVIKWESLNIPASQNIEKIGLRDTLNASTNITLAQNTPNDGAESVYLPGNLRTGSWYELSIESTVNGKKIRATMLAKMVESAACHDFNQNLWQGHRGGEVAFLHAALWGVERINISESDRNSSYFGSSTRAAVAVFQQRYGIANSGDPGWGMVGPRTREKLNDLYGCASFVRVLSPGGGEVIRVGSTYEIRWASSGVENIEIKLVLGANERIWTLSESADAGEGKFAWNVVASDFPVGNDYKIILTGIENSALTDSSRGSFFLVECYDFKNNLRVGNKGQDVGFLQAALLREGFSIPQWEFGKEFGAYTYFAVRAFQQKYPAETMTPYGMTQPNGIVHPGVRYKLNQLWGCSAHVELISPVGGEYWENGQRKDIKWFSSLGASDYKIDLISNATGSTVLTIPRVASNSEIVSYSWLIPDNLAEGQYKIRVSSIGSGDVSDIVDNYFYIAPAGSPPKNCYNFSRNLSLGSQLSDVPFLQTALRLELRGTGIDILDTEFNHAYFGNTTKAAVKSFQEKYREEILAPFGMTVGNGYFGNATRAKMNSLYSCSNRQFTAPVFDWNDGNVSHRVWLNFTNGLGKIQSAEPVPGPAYNNCLSLYRATGSEPVCQVGRIYGQGENCRFYVQKRSVGDARCVVRVKYYNGTGVGTYYLESVGNLNSERIIGATSWEGLSEQINPLPLPTPTPTSTVTPRPTVSPTPSITPTANITPTVQITVTATATVTATPRITPTVTAAMTPTVNVTPTATISATPTSSQSPSNTSPTSNSSPYSYDQNDSSFQDALAAIKAKLDALAGALASLWSALKK